MTAELPAPRREIKLVAAQFRIKAANLGAALAALRDDAQYGHKWTVRRNEQLAARGKLTLPLPATHVESVEAAFETLGFTVSRDRAGDIRLTGFSGGIDAQGDIINALRAVAPHVETNSSLTWESSDGRSWEDRFFRRKLRVREISEPRDLM